VLIGKFISAGRPSPPEFSILSSVFSLPRCQRSRSGEKRTVVMGFLISFRFGHLGANPVEASGQTRATSEKDPRSKKQEKD
jgi:hypothetical protein